MKVSVLRYAAIGMATLSLAGFAAASTVDFDTTGPDSDNNVRINTTNRETVRNHNNVGVANLNLQEANTGDVRASRNTDVDGGLASGDASNSNSTDTSVSVSNSGGSGLAAFAVGGDDSVSMTKTGPDSDNNVHINNNNTSTVSNHNNVGVLNFNLQSANSGNVSAYKNTEVGGLTSGDASNDNTTSTSVEISN